MLSLPSAASSLGDLVAETPDAMVRRLNLTARRNDTPPIMVRLSFKSPPPAEPEAAPPAAVAAAASPAAAEQQATDRGPSPSPPVPPPAVQAPQPTPQLATVATKPPASPAPRREALPAPSPPAAQFASAAVPAKSRPAGPSSSAGKVIAAAPAPRPPNPSPRTGSQTEPRVAGAPGLGASAPPPPPGSTLALVWKPTVERLQEAPPPPRDYDVIDYGALNGYAGRYVRLVTTTGKKVEGRVVGVDSTSVMLRIRQAGGTAELQVSRKLISEIQVPHLRPAGDTD